MIIKNKKLVELDVIDEVLCDLCGKSCSKSPCEKLGHSNQPKHEYAELYANWGFYSDSNNKKYEIHLCEYCFYDVLAYCKLNCKTDPKRLDSN